MPSRRSAGLSWSSHQRSSTDDLAKAECQPQGGGRRFFRGRIFTARRTAERGASTCDRPSVVSTRQGLSPGFHLPGPCALQRLSPAPLRRCAGRVRWRAGPPAEPKAIRRASLSRAETGLVVVPIARGDRRLPRADRLLREAALRHPRDEAALPARFLERAWRAPAPPAGWTRRSLASTKESPRRKSNSPPTGLTWHWPTREAGGLTTSGNGSNASAPGKPVRRLPFGISRSSTCTGARPSHALRCRVSE